MILLVLEVPVLGMATLGVLLVPFGDCIVHGSSVVHLWKVFLGPHSTEDARHSRLRVLLAGALRVCWIATRQHFYVTQSLGCELDGVST